MRRCMLLLLIALFAPFASFAQEEGPPEPEMRELSRRLLEGEWLGDGEMAELRRFILAHPLRPRLDFGQTARYELAEIHLAKGEAREAIACLREVLATCKPDDEAAWVTRFNIAMIHRALNEYDRAAEEFQQVKGNLELLAERELIEMLEREARKPDQAAALLEKRANEAADKGERWAILMRLAALRRRTGQSDQAVAVLQRVAAEATPEQTAALRRAAVEYVDRTFARIRALREQGPAEELDRLWQGLHRRLLRLRIQERHDEADAMERRMREAERQLNQ